jgi:hypothetical protein
MIAMRLPVRPSASAFALAVLGAVVLFSPGPGGLAAAVASGGGMDVQVEQTGTQIAYVVFHALDRDGFCDAAAFGAISLHPVLTDAPNDTIPNGVTGLPSPRATLDVFIDSGDGVIINTSDGPASGARTVIGLHTFSTYDNANSGSPIKAFPPLHAGVVDECQAWVEVVSSLGRAGNVLMIFHDDAGDIGFDRIVNGPGATVTPTPSSAIPQPSTTLALQPGWSLITWSGLDGTALADVLPDAQISGCGAISAIYAWDSADSRWLGYFPGAPTAAGAETLTALKRGQAYWVAVPGSGSVEWQVGVQ